MPQEATRLRRDVRLRQLLEDRRREVEVGLRALREIPLRERDEVRDAPEQSADDFAQDLELAVLEMKSATLALVDEALRRLQQGEYGLCTGCGDSIAEARLVALPFARLCLGCQRAEEEDRESLIRTVVVARVPPIDGPDAEWTAFPVRMTERRPFQ